MSRAVEAAHRHGPVGPLGDPGRTGAALALVPALAVVVRWWTRPGVALALAAGTVVLGSLVEIDLDQRRLPNRLVGSLAAGALVATGIDAAFRSDAGALLRGLLVGSALAGAFLAVSFLGSVGFGDVKLAWPVGVIAGWIGGPAVPVTILVMAFSGGLVAAVALLAGRGRTHTLPYGPFLALGAVAGMLISSP